MENKNYQLTQQGLEDLQKELEHLKTVEREENLVALKEAREQGDLSENADYDAARDEQARIEARIKEIENILKNVSIIKSNQRGKSINIGKKIRLIIDGGEPTDYTIVGSIEANPFKNMISNESPIGKAVIGLKEGDKKTVKTQANKEVSILIDKVY